MLFQSYELFLGILLGVLAYNGLRVAAPRAVHVRGMALLVVNVLVLLTLVREHTLIVLGLLGLLVYGGGVLVRKRAGLLGALVGGLVALFSVRNYPLIYGALEPVVQGPVLSVEKLGLSYILFRWVHWLVENRRGRIERSDVLGFLNYTFFFPTILAGPIDTYRNFAYGGAHRPRRVEVAGAMAGVWRVGLGAFKTLVLVPVVRPWAVDWGAVGWGPVASMGVSLTAYSAFILLDFSGYTDIAIGVGRWMGFRVPENFDRPYGSRSLGEFWRRWHMTFSRFLRAYVFLPLIGWMNRWEALRGRRLLVTSGAYVVTFLVCGLWHGDRLHFVLWGAWHGVGLVVNKLWRERWRPARWQGPGYEAASVAGTWLFVTLGWGMFHYPLGAWAEWWQAVMR